MLEPHRDYCHACPHAITRSYCIITADTYPCIHADSFRDNRHPRRPPPSATPRPATTCTSSPRPSTTRRWSTRRPMTAGSTRTSTVTTWSVDGAATARDVKLVREQSSASTRPTRWYTSNSKSATSLKGDFRADGPPGRTPYDPCNYIKLTIDVSWGEFGQYYNPKTYDKTFAFTQ